MKLLQNLTILAAIIASPLWAKTPSAESTALPERASSERTQWFMEARFGLFIHWGVYAVPAGEWQGKEIKGIGEWIMQKGGIPVADYKAFARSFTASKYDPVAWASLARRAGMKYVVITTKHHDGFALYDSAASDWNAVKASAAGRDLVDPLARAVRAEGLRFGCYYSQSQDWVNPGGEKPYPEWGGSGDWDPAQKGDYDEYLGKVALPQSRELIERYRPDVFWWDTPVHMTVERVRPFAALLAEHPSIISNNRLGKGFKGDTLTPEQHIPPRGYLGEMFEVCMTMNDTWGFRKDDHNWKSLRTLLRNLSDIASKGGNFLLNVGPTAEGEIPAASVERLEAIGRWMAINGEAIYATDASPFPRRLEWGRVTQKRAPGGATTLYLHVWDWPADGRILLPTVTQTPDSARLLAGGGAVTTEPSAAGLVVRLPAGPVDPDVSIVRLDYPGPMRITQKFGNEPGPDGRIGFAATEPFAHGNWEGNLRVKGTGADAYLTDWKNPKWFLEYAIYAPAAGKWTVTAEIAAPEKTPLLLAVGKTEHRVEVGATGADLSWKTLKLGEIALPAGESILDLRAVKEGWNGLSIRNLYLTPAP